ncbi:MAG TPA: hypothetical protein VHA09_03295 [Nitrososphaera sp.]|nr:hypothetical protein [Nitrososphaera sp.]
MGGPAMSPSAASQVTFGLALASGAKMARHSLVSRMVKGGSRSNKY